MTVGGLLFTEPKDDKAKRDTIWTFCVTPEFKMAMISFVAVCNDLKIHSIEEDY